MTSISEENFFSLYQPHAEEFWRTVRWWVTTVIEADDEIVREYRERVREAPIAEQILAYHEAPLRVALDLNGQLRLTHAQRAKLTRLGNDVLPGSMPPDDDELPVTPNKGLRMLVRKAAPFATILEHALSLGFIGLIVFSNERIFEALLKILGIK
jgi:hypothetical protein